MSKSLFLAVALLSFFSSVLSATKYCIYSQNLAGIAYPFSISTQTGQLSLDTGYIPDTGTSLLIALVADVHCSYPSSNLNNVGANPLCYFVDSSSGYVYTSPITTSNSSAGTCLSPSVSSTTISTLANGYPSNPQCGDTFAIELSSASTAPPYTHVVTNKVSTTLIPCNTCKVSPTISPKNASVVGTTLTITGGDFFYVAVNAVAATNGIQCVFASSDLATTFASSVATFVSASQVTCPVPAGLTTYTYSVYLTFNGATVATTQDTTSCPVKFKFQSAGGHSDPHFYGFNGEKMEIKRDANAANQLFHIYCSPLVTITTLFYEYPDKLLFMTKFWVRLGNTLFTLDLSTKPKMLSSGYEGPFFVSELGRFRIDIEDGYLEWDDNMLRVSYQYLKINFSNKLYLNNAPYMNIDISARSTPSEQKITGIVGRTLLKALTNEEFENYLPFQASVSDIVSFSCSSLLDKI